MLLDATAVCGVHVTYCRSLDIKHVLPPAERLRAVRLRIPPALSSRRNLSVVPQAQILLRHILTEHIDVVLRSQLCDAVSRCFAHDISDRRAGFSSVGTSWGG